MVLAALQRADGSILISRRHAAAHQGGLWELPGGKVEPGETPWSALVREVREEVGIRVCSGLPLIGFSYEYPAEGEFPARRLHMRVWSVRNYLEPLSGVDGERYNWVPPERLAEHPFPPANLPINTALRLPRLYQITPSLSEAGGLKALLGLLTSALEAGVRLVCFRDPQLPRAAYRAAAGEISALVESYGGRVLFHCDPDWGQDSCDLHLTGARLRDCSQRPIPKNRWLAASCHNYHELARAEALQADFVVLSPVRRTATHPNAKPMGWNRFAKLCAACRLPVYALGGMESGSFLRAIFSGAQGIAGIRLLSNPVTVDRTVAYCSGPGPQ